MWKFHRTYHQNITISSNRIATDWLIDILDSSRLSFLRPKARSTKVGSHFVSLVDHNWRLLRFTFGCNCQKSKGLGLNPPVFAPHFQTHPASIHCTRKGLHDGDGGNLRRCSSRGQPTSNPQPSPFFCAYCPVNFLCSVLPVDHAALEPALVPWA